MTGVAGRLSDRLVENPIFILDDLGQGEVTDAYMRWLYSLINRCWEWERAIVVTTNLDADAFVNMFGDAIFSRLCDGIIWKFKDKDYRVEK